MAVERRWGAVRGELKRDAFVGKIELTISRMVKVCEAVCERSSRMKDVRS